MGFELYFLFSLAIVPFTGILVRHRLGYYPKPAVSIEIDHNGPPVPSASPPAEGNDSSGQEQVVVATTPSFLEVAKRVKRIEGWAGLYKGFLPTLLSSMILMTFLQSPPGIIMSPSPITVSFGRDLPLLSVLLCNVLYIFGLIFTYRAIATPHKLSFSGTSIQVAMQTLFTEHERKKPWTLWLTPGLLPAFLTGILLRMLVFRPLFVLYYSMKGGMSIPEICLDFAMLVLLLLLSTALLAPLDVIVTRLAVQRNHGVVPELEGQLVDVEKATPEPAELEPAAVTVQLREDKDPYQGLYDCIKKIINEEGWGVLYRGWWLVFLGCIISYYRV